MIYFPLRRANRNHHRDFLTSAITPWNLKHPSFAPVYLLILVWWSVSTSFYMPAWWRVVPQGISCLLCPLHSCSRTLFPTCQRTPFINLRTFWLSFLRSYCSFLVIFVVFISATDLSKGDMDVWFLSAGKYFPFVSEVLGIEPRAACMLGKRSHWATSPPQENSFEFLSLSFPGELVLGGKPLALLYGKHVSLQCCLGPGLLCGILVGCGAKLT